MNGRSTALSLAAGLGLGAAVMYFADPRIGRRRRALVRDKTVSFANDVQRFAKNKGHIIGKLAPEDPTVVKSSPQVEGIVGTPPAHVTDNERDYSSIPN